MTQTKLLVTGLVLVAAGLTGMSLQAPSAGSWGMPMGPMMGWWESPQTSSEQTPPVAGAPTIEVEATEFAFQPDQLVIDTEETIHLTRLPWEGGRRLILARVDWGRVEVSVAARSEMTGRIVVAANRLPVKHAGDGWELSPGGLVSALTPILQQGDGVWVGWTGEVEEKLESFSHDRIDMHTIPLSSTEVDCYYLGLCNETVWPLYHDAVRTPVYRRSWWKTYKQVNTKSR